MHSAFLCVNNCPESGILLTCFKQQDEQSFKMAIFMIETKSTCTTIEVLAKPLRAKKCILIEVFIYLIWRFFKTLG